MICKICLKKFNDLTITGDDAFHIINVMRCKIGDEVLVGSNDKTYLVKIKSLEKKLVTFEIIEEKNGNTELPFFVSLFQGYLFYRFLIFLKLFFYLLF